MDYEFQIANVREEIEPLQQQIRRVLEVSSIRPKQSAAILLALEEAVSNTILHGFSALERHWIKVKLAVDESELRVTVRDDGKPFDPVAAHQRLGKNEAPDKFGLQIIFKSVDQVNYRREGNENVLTLEKRLNPF